MIIDPASDVKDNYCTVIYIRLHYAAFFYLIKVPF